MKQFVVAGLVICLLAVGTWPSSADEPGKDGSKPFHNIFAKRYKNLTPEDERLQQFWHDYYDSLRRYYADLDRIDWVEYYKKRGYQINDAKAGCPECKDAKRIPYASVFVSPSMQWAVPRGPILVSPKMPAAVPGAPVLENLPILPKK